MLKNRKKLLKGFLYIFQIIAQTIDSGTVKFAHSEPEVDIVSSPYYVITHVFKNILERETNGRFKVQIFPGNQLGDIRSITEQCARGTIQMSSCQNTGLLSTYYPEIQVFDIPYLFQNTEIGRIVTDGPFGERIAEGFRKASGIRILGWLPSSLRSFVTRKKEIRTPEDLKGLKIRTMEVPIHIKMVESFGASATPIAWQELYTALQTGVVDGNEQPPFDIIAAKLYEVEKYYTLDHHLLNMTAFIINDDFFSKLSKDDQRIFEYAARQARFAFLGVVQATESEYLKYLENKGMKITAISPDVYEQFRKIAQPAVIEILKKEISPDLINDLLKEVENAEKQVGLR